MIIVDTNVLSELMRREPTPGVVRWLSAQPPASLFTTSVTKAEVLYGVALLPAGERRDALERAVAAMFEEDFKGRVLPFDQWAAEAAAVVAAERRREGRSIGIRDAEIAGIVAARRATLATRNTRHFEGLRLTLVNPWSP